MGSELIPAYISEGKGPDYAILRVMLESDFTVPPECECLVWGSYWLSLRISYWNTGIFGALATQPIGHSGQLGKEQTLPDANDLFSGYGAGVGQSDSAPQTFKSRTAAPLKQFQRLLGHMMAVAAVRPLGLLHMRPLQHWVHGRVPRWAYGSAARSGSKSRSGLPPNLHPMVRPLIS